MKSALLALLFCVVFLQGHGIAATQQTLTKADFYISPTGNDNWSGALAAVNADHSDGPFATLQRARDAVRKQKRQQPDKDLLVLIRDGVYPLNRTVTFGIEDSREGDKGMVATYRPNGKTLVRLGSTGNGGVVEVSNKTGETIANMHADEYGNGVVGAWNRKGMGGTLKPGP